MSNTVGIIGVGHVGASVADTLMLRESVSKIILIDKNDKKSQAEQNDLMDQNSFLSNDIVVEKINYQSNWSSLSECDVLVISAGDIKLLGGENPDRLAELKNSVSIINEIAPKIKNSGFNGIVVNITNPCDVVVTYLQNLLYYPKDKIIGTGTTLDTSRMRKAVASQFNCGIQDVSGFVMGEHGESQFTAWSTVRVAGTPIVEKAKEDNLDLNGLKEQARLGAWYIINGKGFTSYGIGITTTVIAEAILNDARKVFSLSSYNEKYKTYVGQLTRIGKTGVIKNINIDLNDKEKDLFKNSAQGLRKKFEEIVK
ncbi:lactate/malate family dehydrogenase [Companilactobacillus sp. HBUAS59544]|jgi:malate/lactate dehydrogenase|uniref:lactate/malate family dehydrogenase n=1 Tax=Companilactobacillus sp. HBUAS59544 TaxID=3109363 RepID=UPI002FF111A0